MNRIIKFRAWDKREQKMWTPIIDQDGMPCAKHPITCQLVRMDGDLLDPVMQFTGLKDSEGNDIYEGDILQIDPKVAETIGARSANCLVGFYQGGFMFGRTKTMYMDTFLWLALSHNNKTRVIGNIHQNPGLLTTEAGG